MAPQKKHHLSPSSIAESSTSGWVSTFDSSTGFPRTANDAKITKKKASTKIKRIFEFFVLDLNFFDLIFLNDASKEFFSLFISNLKIC